LSKYKYNHKLDIAVAMHGLSIAFESDVLGSGEAQVSTGPLLFAAAQLQAITLTRLEIPSSESFGPLGKRRLAMAEPLHFFMPFKVCKQSILVSSPAG